MPAYLSPICNDRQFDSNGNPLAGGLIYTYQAGTSTPIATYTDAAGLIPQANPIVLNSGGLVTSPIWLNGGTAVKFVVQTSTGVTLRTIDNVQGLNDPAFSNTVDQWVTFGNAATFVSASSFSVAGDQTPIFQVGRRVRANSSGGLRYGTVRTSTFAANVTTVVVTLDAGSLDAGTTQVAYGLLSATNSSVPVPAGTILQELVFTDAGSSTASATLANVTASAKSITPKSANSTILIDVLFDATVLAGGAGNNTVGTYQLYNNTAASNIGNSYGLGVSSSVGANLQTQSPTMVRASVANTGTTAIAFILRARYASAATTVSAVNHVWTIREIQN